MVAIRPARVAVAGACGIAAGVLSLGGCDVPDSARGTDSLLGLWSEPTPEDAARMAINQWDADERARGTMLLANGYFGGEDIYRLLYIEQLDDEDPNVRAAGIRGLTLHGQPEDVPLLVEATADANARVRLEAVRSLQRTHNPAAIDGLIVRSRLPVLERPGVPGRPGETEPTIRAEAVHALGQYADPRVMVPLIAALDDRFLAVNRAARRSLNTLTGVDVGVERKAWLQWYEGTEEPFAGRTAYIYPVFSRGKFWWEYIPFVPAPPNETASTPVGFPPAIDRQDSPDPDSNG